MAVNSRVVKPIIISSHANLGQGYDCNSGQLRELPQKH